jgi:hypothetical protein
METKDIVLSIKSQVQKQTMHALTHMWEFKKLISNKESGVGIARKVEEVGQRGRLDNEYQNTLR